MKKLSKYNPRLVAVMTALSALVLSGAAGKSAW